MPEKGLGLLRIKDYSEQEWKAILKQVEAVLSRSDYNHKTFPWGKRNNKHETIQYARKLKTMEYLEKEEIFTDKPKIGLDLSAILMSIEYLDDTSQIPHKVEFKPYCWGWDVKFCENGMAVIDVVWSVFTKTGLFKCTYYCSSENQSFITKTEQKETEEQALNVALLTNTDFRRTITTLANKL